MMIRNPISKLGAPLLVLALVACQAGEAEAPPAAAPAAEAPTGPTPGEQEYAALTAGWAPEAIEGCGRVLEETLGTRDLVKGALDGVSDPAGKATAEIEDARHWLDQGNAKVEEVRPLLEAGTCDGRMQLALDEAVQFYVKAGTSAVQAGQIAGG